MTQIAIVGAGRVGVACATLLHRHNGYSVAIIDAEESALRAAGEALKALETNVDLHMALSKDQLEAKLTELKPQVVLCCTPFHVNITVAGLCAKHKWHYVDFTEDVAVTKAVTELAPTKSTFVLQTGLAPGLVNSIALELCHCLQRRGATSESVHMRVGALPLVGVLPAAYSLTWSSAGLVNEYYQPVEKIVDGEVVSDNPLDDHEELIANGVRLEAFNTSGGLGSPSMYLNLGIKNADYKTMRYPGHLEFLEKNLVTKLREEDPVTLVQEGVKIVESLFTFTRQDVVYMVVRAIGRTPTGRMLEEVFERRWHYTYGLTALELTTAGTGCAVVELLMLGQLQPGVLFGGEVPFHLMANTTVGSVFIDQSS